MDLIELITLYENVDCPSVIPFICSFTVSIIMHVSTKYIIGPRQANLVLIAYASSEGSGEPANPRSLARTSAARSYKQ